jgi:hypothetical protein
MDRVFQIVAVILAGIAAYFLWAGNKDGAFVSAVLGCVSFFLSIRAQATVRRRQREEEERAEAEPASEGIAENKPRAS